jgi:Dolichyl-phosphate-mannose-protein mannosyltransferase
LIFFFVASLLLSLTGGILLTFLFCPSRKKGAAGPAFRFFAGGGLGIGVASCLYFVCLLTGLTRYLPAIDLGVCLLLGIPCFIFFRRNAAGQGRPLPERGKRFRFPILLTGIFSVELAASLGSFVFAFLKEPHGKWDAWLIWNMHARFLFRGGDHWRDAFASGLDWSHWDYPLLLPLSIARGWQYMGGESLNIPAVMAFVFTFMTLGLLWSALSLLRSQIQGCLAAMILLGTPFFIVMGASQFADVPLAFFILATLVLLSLQARSPENHPGALILAGLAAGLAAWTKNEGLLFLGIVTGSLFCTAVYAGGWRSALNRTAGFLAGALPILLMVIYFKTQLSPANDLMAGFGPAAAAAKLTDFGRYAEIAKAFFITGISFTQGLIDIRVGMHLNPGAVNILLLIGYLFLAGVHIDGRDRISLLQSAAVLGLMLIGYFFVYVLTPLNLSYHLFTSLNRLFLQLWPGVIFLCFMIAGSPETPPGDRPGTAPAQPETRSTRVNKPRKKRGPK